MKKIKTMVIDNVNGKYNSCSSYSECYYICPDCKQPDPECDYCFEPIIDKIECTSNGHYCENCIKI